MNSQLQFESDKRSRYADDVLKYAQVPPPFKKNLYMKQNNNYPANIITLRDNYEKIPIRVQPPILNDDYDGTNYAFLNAYNARRNVSEYLVEPQNLPKAVLGRTPSNAPKMKKPITFDI